MRMLLTRLASLLLLLLCNTSPVLAAPHINRTIPEPIELPGRTLEERAAQSIQPSMMLAAPVSYTSPTTVNVLFLRVEFQPEPNPSGARVTGNGLWNSYLPPAVTGSSNPDHWVTNAKMKFTDYWKEVSYGLLTVVVDLSTRVYQLPQTMAYYAGGTAISIENIIYDSITTVNTDATTTINFAQYDGVFIVHAGVGQETDTTGVAPNDLWSLYYSGGSSICRNAAGSTCLSTKLKDGRPLSEAIIMPQTDSRTGLVVDPLGVYVHEFGHWLGLPDLYCVSTSSPCTTEGVGMWSLMDYGSYNASASTIRGSSPAHLDAWSLLKLGWVSPDVLNPAQPDRGAMSLFPVAIVPAPVSGAAGTNVLKAQASTTNANQYFLIENRRKIGFDEGLPGEGLLVWLINQDVINAALATNTVNSRASAPGVKLIEADGDWALQNAALHDFGSAGDPFPGSRGNTTLSPMTSPSSIPYTAFGWLNIRSIVDGSSAISFKIGFGPRAPVNLRLDRAAKQLSWDANTEIDINHYLIYKNNTSTPLVSVPTTSAANYVDSTFTSTDVYMVTAVDTNGNESQAAVIAPVILVSPLTLTFSDSVTSNTVNVLNNGNADLVFSAMSLNGSNSAEFSYTSACPSTLTIAASCQITISFAPRSTGSKSASFTISSNDPQSQAVSVQLSGNLTQASQPASNGGGSSSRSPCFIATAAYGSYLDPHVEVLRQFRDGYLMTNMPGRAFVKWYYHYSPPIADYIGSHEVLRTAVRWSLAPLILGIEYPWLIMLVMILGSGMLLYRKRISNMRLSRSCHGK